MKIAHIAADGRTHGLEEHLRESARRAGEFAATFDSAGWGRLAGLWHDLGKYSEQFQNYINTVNSPDAHISQKGGDHSTAGALLAADKYNLGRVLAYIIAGHHAGLPDWQEGSPADLSQRLQATERLDNAVAGGVTDEILNQSLPCERPKTGTDLALSFWLRMLFSCVVDADFLDTESFFDPEKSARRGNYPQLAELLPDFLRYMENKQSAVAKTTVNHLRAEVFHQCVAKAQLPPGLFTLTVPTGGAKTLSSLAFGLHHAQVHNKRRIIYVIPYTSIIEQTSEQFRNVWPARPEVVVEHHSNLDVDDINRDSARSRLASENWDAPIIVTTSVQFFESLFASRTSRCRKLHNIVNSVVIFDEAQLLPPDYLNPILLAVDELRKNYGVTVVFCTATQPALGPHKTLDFDFKGLTGMTEICANPTQLFNQLNRTNISILDELRKPADWTGIAKRLIGHESVLCIVNRRDDARILWEQMPEGTVHLSALMCGAHRSQRIAAIRQSLQEGTPTRVISTQLVEAGVDVDFPVVYRALAGIDSIAQAAGRCNREGLRERGEVFVFHPPSEIPVGHLRQAAQIGGRLLTGLDGGILTPAHFEQFFREFYWGRGNLLDKQGIVGLLKNDSKLRVSFREAASRFKLIDEAAQASVVVRYRNDALLEQLETHGPERWLLRRLQRYVVNIPRRLHERLLNSGVIREICPGVYLQASDALYDDDLGFCPDRSLIHEPDELTT